VRLETMREIVEGGPVQIWRAGVAPEPDLIDGAVVREQLGQQTFEEGRIGWRPVGRLVVVQR
jgi:hypothetical protein